MNHVTLPEHMTEALARAHQHWQERHGEGSPTAVSVPTAFTIAISRETGTYGAAIAREVANRLGWPLYDRELLQRIADDMGVRRTLLESVDERRVGWVSESLANLFSVPTVTEADFYRHLVEALLSLAAHGNCVIVGRGANFILPQATTLRVRLVAPLEHRVQAVQNEHGISCKEATQRVETTDLERNRFLTGHFLVNPTDPANYDLVLNTARFSKEECADFVIAALAQRRRHAKSSTPARVLQEAAGV